MRECDGLILGFHLFSAFQAISTEMRIMRERFQSGVSGMNESHSNTALTIVVCLPVVLVTFEILNNLED